MNRADSRRLGARRWPPAPRRLASGLGLGLALGLSMALTGCTSAGSGKEAPDGTDLFIAVTDQGTTQSWSLQCDPPSGSHPKAKTACEFLTESRQTGVDPFAPVPGDRACTEIYGGPQLASVMGTWEGVQVESGFSRTDGCQIARWNAALPLLVVRGGVTAPGSSPK